MPDTTVTQKDTDRLIERLREAYDSDPERYSHLAIYIDNYPDDFDPEEVI